MSRADDRTDRLYRDALGWPAPHRIETPAAIVADLRAMLADRRRRRELRHKTLAQRATTSNERTHHA